MIFKYMKWCPWTHNTDKKKLQLKSTLRYYFSSIKLAKITKLLRGSHKEAGYAHTFEHRMVEFLRYPTKLLIDLPIDLAILFYTKYTPLQTENNTHNLLWSSIPCGLFPLQGSKLSVGLLSLCIQSSHLTLISIPCLG